MFRSKKRSRKTIKPRTHSLESLEERRLLEIDLRNDWLFGCDCECSCGGGNSVSPSNGSGNGTITSTGPNGTTISGGANPSDRFQPKQDDNGPKVQSVNSTGTNPHPIIRVEYDASGFNSGEYIKAYVTLLAGGQAAGNRVSAPIFLSGVDAGGKRMLSFQVDATGYETGLYEYEFGVTLYDSEGLVWDDPDVMVGVVPVVNRVFSPYGNRWWQDGLDQLIVQNAVGSDTRPQGALFVKANGTAVFYAEGASDLTYLGMDGDPEFASLTHSSGTFTLTSRDGTVRTFSDDDSIKELQTRTDADGNTTTYAYASDRVTSITDWLGRVTEFAYSGTQLDEITEYNGNKTNFLYEQKVIDNPDPTPDEYTYITSAVLHPDPDGSGPLPRPRIDYTYSKFDDFNWLMTSISGPETPGSGQLRQVTRLTYDTYGRIETIVHPDGTADRYDSIQSESMIDLRITGFDDENMVSWTSLTDPGEQEYATKNVEGASYDRAGAKSRFKLDRYGYPIETIDPSNYKITYGRNDLGQITSIVEDPDGANLTTEFTYDGSDRLASIVWAKNTADEATRSFAYDTSHRLTQITDEVGRVTKFGYSGNSRTPVYVQQVVGTAETLSYNSSTGVVTGASDDIVWSFLLTSKDGANPNTTSDDLYGGMIAKAHDPLGRTTVYDYYTKGDAAGSRNKLKSITLPKATVSGTLESTAPKIEYEYDSKGFLSKVTESGQEYGTSNVVSRATEYLNDSFGRLLKMTLPDPDGAGPQKPEYRYFYDVFDRLVAKVDPDISISGTSTAPTRSTETLAVNVTVDAGNTEIDLTQYFSDDVDTDFGLTYIVTTDETTPTPNNTPEVFRGIHLPSSRPGILVLDTTTGGDNSGAIMVKAVDSHGNVSLPLTITVTVSTTPEFILNSTTTDSQRKPSIARMPDGGFAAAWLERIVANGKFKVKARVFGPDGRPVTSEVTVRGEYDSTSSTYPPSITVTEDNHIVVAWHENTVPTAFDSYFSRYDLSLQADASHQAIAIPSDLVYDQYVPMLAAIPGGGFIATFYGGSTAGTQSEVWFRRFDANADVLDANQIKANQVTANAQYRPAVAVAPDGSFVISWQGNGPTDSNGAFARRFDASGTALLGEESLLYSVPASILDEQQLETDVAALTDGSFVIVWASDETDGATTNYDIFYRRMDAHGVLLGSRTLVNDSSTANQESPKVAALSNGGFNVTWYAPDASSTGVFAKPFDGTFSAGTQISVNVTSTGHTNGNQFFPDLLEHPDGGVTYVWEGSGTGDSQGIFARHIPAATTTGPFVVKNFEVGPVVRGKIDRFIVTFSEPVNFGTVAGADFTLTKPGGSALSINSTVYQLSLTQALVVFNQQLDKTGEYTITVGTGIDRATGSPAALSASFTGTFFYAAGAITTYEYDQENRVSAEIDGLGGRTTYTYTQRGDVETVTDALGRTTRYVYDDPRGLLTKVILPDPDGAGSLASPEIEYDYYADGSLKEVTDANDKVTTYRYDSRHRLKELEQPGNIDTLFKYTKASELAVVTDPLGHMQTTTYDALGRVVKSSMLAADSTKVSKDDDDTSPSFVATGTWPEDNTAGYAGGHQTANASGTQTAKWEFTLDRTKTYEVFVTWVEAAGRSTSAPYSVYDGTDTGILVRTVSVDQTKVPSETTAVFADNGGKWRSLGDVNITDANGKLTVKLGDVATGTVSADAVRVIESSPTKYEYDKASNLEYITDAMGSKTQQVFDERDRRIDLYLPHPDTGAGSGSGRPRTQFTFDSFGNLRTLNDPVNNTTTWVPDLLDRVTTETDALSGVRTYKYDSVGNVIEAEDRLDRVRRFAYDRGYRMTKEEWFANISDVTADRTISYNFDVVGQLLGTTDRDGATPTPNKLGADYSYLYDNLGRVTQTTTDIIGLTNSVPHVYQEFAYDAMSRRTEAKASYGSTLGGATKDYKNGYAYDDLGRLDVLTQRGQSGGNTVSEKYVDFAYNTIGQFTNITRYDDVDTPTNQIIASTYLYDDLGRLKKLEHKDNGVLRAGYEWKHNANGWLTSMDFLVSGWDAEDATYAYDKNGQVKTGDRANTANDESYQYDLNGNRTQVGTTTWTVNSDNRINRDGTYEYTYDAEGNLYRRVTLMWNGSAWVATGATTEYRYDHRNRLVSVIESFTPGGTPSKWTDYTYDAFDRRVSKAMNTNPTTTAIDRYEFYVWDGDDVVLDFVDSDGGSSPSASLDKRYLWGSAVDQILAQESAGGTVRWMLADHQGTVRDTVDNAGAPAGDHIVIDAFGKITSGTLTTRFAYTGQEWDGDAGLYYYNARWYDPRSGRFVTKDPIGFFGGDTNVYRYVWNNVTSYIDPSGLQGGAFMPPPGGRPVNPWAPEVPPHKGPNPWWYDEYMRALNPFNDRPAVDAGDDLIHVGKFAGWGMFCIGTVGAGLVEALGVGGVVIGGAGSAQGAGAIAGAGTAVGGALEDGILGPPCFPPGTLVLMADGTTKKIEDIRVGDMVLAVDPTSAVAPSPHRVADTCKNWTDRLVRIQVRANSEQVMEGELVATRKHLMWTKNREWQCAEDLNTDDVLQDDSGRAIVVQRVNDEEITSDTHNLLIDDVHTYFVVVNGLPILVHNGVLKPGDVPPIGTPVNRWWGGAARPDGTSWTTGPIGEQTRECLGLGLKNSADHLSEGTLIDNTGVVVKAADPWDGFGGGGIEIVVPDPAKQIDLGAVQVGIRLPAC